MKLTPEELASRFGCRPETGTMQFGDDWSGTFIRGDNAGWLAFKLTELRDLINKVITGKATIEELKQDMGPLGLGGGLNEAISLLGGSYQDAPGEIVQHMKPFEQCFDRVKQNDQT